MVQKQNCLNTTWNSRSITARCLLLLSRIWPSFTEDLNWKKTGNSLEWLYLVDTLIDNLGLCPSSTKGVEGCGKNLKQSFPHYLVAWVPEQGKRWWIANIEHLNGGLGIQPIQWFLWNWYVSIVKNQYNLIHDRTSAVVTNTMLLKESKKIPKNDFRTNSLSSHKNIMSLLREGIKKSIFLGKSPKQRTPPTHRYGLGLT